MVLGVAHHHIGRGDVPQRAEVGHYGCRICVKSHVLAVLGPVGVAGKAQHYLIARHLLDHATRLHALARVYVAHPGVLVGPEHATGHLSEDAAYQPVRIVRGAQHGGVARKHIVGGGLAEALGHVHIVPVGQRRGLVPVGRVTVYLPGQLQQEFIARAVVEPQHRIEVVAAATVLPVVLQELVVGQSQLPLEVARHQTDNAGIVAVLIVSLEGT